MLTKQFRELNRQAQVIENHKNMVNKQETIEDAAERLFNNFQKENPIIPTEDIRPFKLGFIKGIKWKEERMYSEEDMVEFSKWRIIYEDENPNNVKHSKKLLKEWVEQHKKK
jgi:hypothetical protein